MDVYAVVISGIVIFLALHVFKYALDDFTHESCKPYNKKSSALEINEIRANAIRDSIDKAKEEYEKIHEPSPTVMAIHVYMHSLATKIENNEK